MNLIKYIYLDADSKFNSIIIEIDRFRVLEKLFNQNYMPSLSQDNIVILIKFLYFFSVCFIVFQTAFMYSYISNLYNCA